MSKAQSSTFKISTINPELFSIHAVARSPRSMSPHDLISASKNVKREYFDPQISGEARAFIRFLFEDYFVNAHGSGLYNRQLNMWESIAKIADGKVEPISSGWFFQKKTYPVDQITFYDGLQRVVLIAWVVKERQSEDFLKELLTYLTLLLKMVNKMKLQESVLTGVFFCFPAPTEAAFVEKVEKLVGANDPVAKYESRLPEPANIPLNLVLYEAQAESDSSASEEANDYAVQLLHPKIRK